MKYEHLIEVNDPYDPAIIPLTRSQLWRGLVMRAERPGEFVYGLDTMRIRARGDSFIERELHFGSRIINDLVRFIDAESISYSIEPSPEFPASHLLISIEEPSPTHLFLRFEYETLMQDGAEFEDFIKQAYYAADLDTVQRIRALAAEGLLD